MHRRLVIFSIIILLVSLILEWWARPCHFLLTADSYHYISAGHSFHESGVFQNADGSPFIHWGPLFPFILSLFDDPQRALAWINVFCKIVISVVVFQLAEMFLKRDVTKGMYFVGVLLSVQLLMISVFLWSDLIFMALVYLNLYAALRTDKHPAYFYTMFVTGFLFCLQRYVGAFWIAGTSCWLLFEHASSWKKRLFRSSTYFFICISGMIAWIIFNDPSPDHRSEFDDRNYFGNIFSNSQSIVRKFSESIFPLRESWATFSGCLLVIVLIYVVVKHFKMNRNFTCLAILLSIYTAGFIPVTFYEEDLDRYYAIILPIVSLFLFMAFEDVTEHNPAIRRAAVIFLCLLALYPLARSGKNAQMWRRNSCSGVSLK